MTLTTGQQVRLKIQDPYRYETEVFYGDSTASGFKLRQGQPYSTISATATASIATTGGWSATGCTFNYIQGRVLFSGVISANSAIQADYFWSVFSEDELAYFTAVGGDAVGGAIEAIKCLMADYAKRARWGAPDGTTYDDTQAYDKLKSLYDDLLTEQAGEAGEPQGGGINWGEEQQFYGY